MIALLDTNAYTAMLAGSAALADGLSRASRILMSAIVVGELEFGFQNGQHTRRNTDLLTQFLNESVVHFATVTRDTTRIYGAIASRLRQAGTPIPTNDIWIAAQSIEHRAVLFSVDRHMGHVDGLRVQGF